jgi:hypothetical protein
MDPDERPRSEQDGPRATLALLNELQAKHGLTAQLFTRIHHFGPRASLESHRKYCQGTKSFRSQTNIIVARRLAECLKRLDSGGDWESAIKAIQKHHPFPGAEP